MGSIVYLPCLSGPIAVQASDSPAGLRLLWSASVGGGPPIRGRRARLDHRLERCPLRPRPVDRSGLGAGDDRCPGQPLPHPVHRRTGLLLAPSANRIVAFSASGAAGTTTTSTTRLPTHDRSARALSGTDVDREQPFERDSGCRRGGRSCRHLRGLVAPLAAQSLGETVLRPRMTRVGRRRGGCCGSATLGGRFPAGRGAVSGRRAGSRARCRARPRPARSTR